ncbi:threonine/serine exporter family protein [Virgibacillus soli]|uniref:threonine/serine exporter family protein n=1 Tax=Paracerasibacillus soli TaxID=480284 RepID=UPI0035EECF23
MTIIAQLGTSFFAASGFAVIFNAPRNRLIPCGVVGMLGWVLYFILVQKGIDSVPATVFAAMLIAVLSQVFAKYYKTPIIIFNVAGIIPLVPGGMAYNAMRHFVENDYAVAMQYVTKVMLLSGGIGLGLMFSEVINQVVRKVWKN